MLHQPRYNLPGIAQHIIHRGIDLEPCFYSTADYLYYLDDLKRFAAKYHCRIHAYVLMMNHVHLLLTPMAENGVPHMMKALAQHYRGYMNEAHNIPGELWEERYRASLIDSEIFLLSCMCYIELNPVRAGMVKHPSEYKWSSYLHNAKLQEGDIVEYHPVYAQLGETDDERKFVYRELFQRYMENDTIHKIRDALNHELVLGGAGFKDKIEEMINKQTRLGKPGHLRVKEDGTLYCVLSDYVT